MNKLEEYRNYLSKDILAEYGTFWYNRGFDAAIELDLPVKFAEWQRHPEGKGLQEMLLHFGYYPSMQEKYKYWIDNIYKLDI